MLIKIDTVAMISVVDMVLWVSIPLNVFLFAVLGWEKGWWSVFSANEKVSHPKERE